MILLTVARRAGKFLQWFWFLEATFNPPLTEIIHHTVLLAEEKRVKEVEVVFDPYATHTPHLR